MFWLVLLELERVLSFCIFLARYFADVANGDKSFYFQTEKDDIIFFKDLRENDEFEVISIKSFPKVETVETMLPLFADMSNPVPPCKTLEKKCC